MNTLIITLIVASINLTISNCYILDPGPLVKATKGEVWPKPQKQTYSAKFHIVRPKEFNFKVVGESCKILIKALERYTFIIQSQTLPKTRVKHTNNQQPKSWQISKQFIGYLNSLDVILMDPCTEDVRPSYNMLEQYELNIPEDSNTGVLAATSVWGILRGLETFSQLLYPMRDVLQINATSINDFPRYAHRGVLLDTSRHFIPVPKILKVIDGLAYSKFNVFHWHITDDQSFPYQSISFPELSNSGAYLRNYVYSQENVSHIIEYAALRGIRVLVEFDTPGHTRCLGLSRKELLTPCFSNNVPSGEYGPMDPSKEFTFSFMKDLLEEVSVVFPDSYLHLGGDEVGYECWESNPDIKQFMAINNIGSFNKLEGYYIKKIIDISNNLKKTSIVWEEVFTNVEDVPKDTLIQVWRDDWKSTINNVTKAGFQTLLSSCWYLDHLSTGGDWVKFYNCEPTDFEGNEAQKKLIVGGEACMWTEVVNEYNVESRIWPRASATAEKLWSALGADVVKTAQERLEEHTCRMNKRGIQAQPPNGAGFCEI